MSIHNVITEINAAPDVAADFKTTGIKADVIAESTSAAGVTIDGVLLKDSGIESAGTITATGGIVGGDISVSGLSSTGILGFETGAGGTVTQATSKSTGVTLSKNCGEIVMNNESLAGAAEVSFIVTNTLVAATDVILVCCKTLGSGGTGTYIPFVTLVGDGSFTITVANVGATASEAVVLNFVVIKAVAA
jgi:hypothetical protein